MKNKSNNYFTVIDENTEKKFEIEKSSDFGRIIRQELQKIISLEKFREKFSAQQKAEKENIDFILD